MYAAMTQPPEMVGGTTRDVTSLLQHVPGVVAKDVAHGVSGGALSDCCGVAFEGTSGGHPLPPPGALCGSWSVS